MTGLLPRTAVVLGGASDIGLAIVRRLGASGLTGAVLATREPAPLVERLAREPVGADAHVETWDALDPGGHERLFRRAVEHLGSIDLVICAVGSLGHHAGLSVAAADADLSIRTNFAGPAAALLVAARHLEVQGHGTIVVLSSVAGARARKSNFVYGSAKAGLDAFAQGLGDALAGTGVRVLIVRPGFVVSKMTDGLEPAPLATTPEAVAVAVAHRLSAAGGGVMWVPSALGPMMAVLRNVPAPLWRRIAADR